MIQIHEKIKERKKNTSCRAYMLDIIYIYYSLYSDKLLKSNKSNFLEL